MSTTLEVTVGGWTAAEAEALIEWLRERGFKVGRSHHNGLAKITAERAERKYPHLPRTFCDQVPA
jgi:hypothetical protein